MPQHSVRWWQAGKFSCGARTMRSSVIKLPHSVIVKSSGLLPMHYTVHELAKEIDAVERTLRDWLSNGAPHLKDATGRIWIHGREFAGWVNRVKKPGSKQKSMKENEGYCMHCRSSVKMLSTSTKHIRGKLTMTRGTCSQCGRIIHRGGRMSSNPVPIQQGGPNQSHE